MVGGVESGALEAAGAPLAAGSALGAAAPLGAESVFPQCWQNL